ncbi:MAG: GDP-mannose 4,6-dehydratase [Pirellulaceae bacterium]
MPCTLVTGGAGFIGSHLLRTMLHETTDRLVCLDNFNDFYSPEQKRQNVRLLQALDSYGRISFVEGDFTNAATVANLFEQHDIRRIVHLGAYAGVRYSVENPGVYQHNNIYGTLVLLEACRDRPIERFLLISSSTVYGKGADVPFKEDGQLGIPASPYGATKRAAELLGLTYQQLHGVPVVCIRPFSIYGPGLRPDLALSIFTSRIANGQPITVFGDGSVRRDFTHVTDFCRGLLSALETRGIDGQCFNLGHGNPVVLSDLIGLLENAIGRTAVVHHQAARPEDLDITFADLERARKTLGFEPRIDIEAGIREYVDWFLSQTPSSAKAA